MSVGATGGGSGTGHSRRSLCCVLAILVGVSIQAVAQPPLSSPPAVIVAAPPFDAFFSCTEHFQGQFEALGDALGTDCFVQRMVEVDGRAWLRAHRGDGTDNADWFGWRQPVLSPCDCVVVRLRSGAATNSPGIPGAPPADFVVLERDDGVHFLIAHIREPSVAVGDLVRAGQAIAKVGNNGYSRSPHVHLGAWRQDTALQIRFDQSMMRLPPGLRGK